MTMLIERAPVAICPQCHLEKGTAVQMTADHGYIVVTYQCPKCRSTWTRGHRDVDPDA